MTFGLASFLSIFVPALIGLICLGKTQMHFKYFTYFIFIMCIVECIGNYLFYQHKANLQIYSLSLSIETIVIVGLLSRNFHNRYLKILVFTATGIFLLNYIYMLPQIFSMKKPDTELRIQACVLLIFVAGISMVRQSKNMEVSILANPMFVLSFALLLYYAATIFVHGALHLILEKSFKLVAKQIWNAHSVVNIITNILFALSIWLSYRQKKLSL